MSNPIVTAHHPKLDATVEVPRSSLPYFDGFVEVDASGNEVEVVNEESAPQLKGAALDEALDQRGLSKAGTADEKRARIVEHDANLGGTPETGGDPAALDGSVNPDA